MNVIKVTVDLLVKATIRVIFMMNQLTVYTTGIVINPTTLTISPMSKWPSSLTVSPLEVL